VTKPIMLGFGHPLTIDAASSITTTLARIVSANPGSIGLTLKIKKTDDKFNLPEIFLALAFSVLKN
jgi:hypothetical protein